MEITTIKIKKIIIFSHSEEDEEDNVQIGKNVDFEHEYQRIFSKCHKS